MKGETLSTKGEDFFPSLEKHYWNNWKTFDFIIHENQGNVAVMALPKTEMKSILKEVSKREKKRRKSF